MLGTQVHHTTAYHPQSNGLVERFHRHLKSALRARLTGPNWTQELPWALLGIRTAPKEDLGCSSAELVYGAPLTVPGDFSPNLVAHDNPTSPFLQQFHEHIRSYKPVPTSQHGTFPSSVPHDLHQAKFVFIRRDSHRTPLQRPYEGPFKVLHPGPKFFKVEKGGKQDTISVDRLKPAYIDPSTIVQTTPKQSSSQEAPKRKSPPSKTIPASPPIATSESQDQDTTPPPPPPVPQYTRSGRQVNLPKRYISVLMGSGVADRK